MIRHLVLFKLKPGVTRDDPRVAKWMELSAALPSQIPQIVDWEGGWNVTDRPIAYDFGQNSSFASREDLAAYLPHPAHQAMVAVAREVADWVLADYEIQGSSR
jgi:hypothetical protein